MNYYKVRERADGKFDFAAENDGHVRPVGYCAGYHPIPPDAPWLPPGEAERYNADEAPLAGKYHTDGHATAAEAAACYREYLLDHKLRLMQEHPGHQEKCLVCEAWTTFYALLDMHHWTLCPAHNTRDQTEAMFTLSASTEITSSY